MHCRSTRFLQRKEQGMRNAHFFLLLVWLPLKAQSGDVSSALPGGGLYLLFFFLVGWLVLLFFFFFSLSVTYSKKVIKK